MTDGSLVLGGGFVSPCPVCTNIVAAENGDRGFQPPGDGCEPMGIEYQHLCSCGGCAGGCVTFTFANGPYLLLPAPSAPFTTFEQVMDLGAIDLSCLTPGNGMFFRASFTFLTPVGWSNIRKGFARITVGATAWPIGSSSPPLTPFQIADNGADGGFMNALATDPGPVGATTTVTVDSGAGFTVPAVPGNAVPIKLILTSHQGGVGDFTTDILAASLKVCDHEFV